MRAADEYPVLTCSTSNSVKPDPNSFMQVYNTDIYHGTILPHIRTGGLVYDIYHTNFSGVFRFQICRGECTQVTQFAIAGKIWL